MAKMVTLATLALAMVARIPVAAAENGVFEHHVDDNGFAVVKRVANLTESTSDWGAGVVESTPSLYSAKFRERRADKKDEARCTSDNGIIFFDNDIDMAAYSLETACDASVASGKGDEFVKKTLYAIKDGVVAYVCNFGSKNQHCTSGEVKTDFENIKKTCFNGAGYFQHGDWRKGYGYTQWTGKVDFCPDKWSN